MRNRRPKKEEKKKRATLIFDDDKWAKHAQQSAPVVSVWALLIIFPLVFILVPLFTRPIIRRHPVIEDAPLREVHTLSSRMFSPRESEVKYTLQQDYWRTRKVSRFFDSCQLHNWKRDLRIQKEILKRKPNWPSYFPLLKEDGKSLSLSFAQYCKEVQENCTLVDFPRSCIHSLLYTSLPPRRTKNYVIDKVLNIQEALWDTPPSQRKEVYSNIDDRYLTWTLEAYIFIRTTRDFIYQPFFLSQGECPPERGFPYTSLHSCMDFTIALSDKIIEDNWIKTFF